jgi:Tfp pilus assembly protein PilF|eukprot:SAG25_NODE_5_length_29351_cov_43.404335_21_plen_307_part_00
MPAASKKGAGGKALALRPHPPTKAAGDGGGGPTTTLLNHAPTALARHTPATVGFTVAAERQQEHDISVAMAAPLAPPSDSSDDAATATYLAQRGLGTLAEGGVGGAGGGRPSAKDALRDFDEATKLDPTLSMAYYGRGSYYISLEQYEEAAQQLDEAVRLNALDAMAWFSRGEVHRILGRHQLALRDLDEAIRLDAGNETAFRGRAEVHIADGHFAEAITDLQEALDIEPSLHDLAARRIADIECQIKDAQVKGLIEAGVAFMQLGKDTEALARLHEAVEVRPDCAEAYSSMGTLFHKGGQLEEGK